MFSWEVLLLRCKLACIRSGSRDSTISIYVIQLSASRQTRHRAGIYHIFSVNLRICPSRWTPDGSNCEILHSTSDQTKSGLLEANGRGDVKHSEVRPENQGNWRR